jgi:hypothetical protein
MGTDERAVRRVQGCPATATRPCAAGRAPPRRPAGRARPVSEPQHADGLPGWVELDPACHLGDRGRVPLTGRGYPTGLHATFSDALRRLPVAGTVGMVLADGDHEGGGGLIALLIILLVLYLLFRR